MVGTGRYRISAINSVDVNQDCGLAPWLCPCRFSGGNYLSGLIPVLLGGESIPILGDYIYQCHVLYGMGISFNTAYSYMFVSLEKRVICL